MVTLRLAAAAALLLGAAPAQNPKPTAQRPSFSLRFFGNGVNDIDRVKIRIDDPDLANDPGPPVDVGAEDFTIEF